MASCMSILCACTKDDVTTEVLYCTSYYVLHEDSLLNGAMHTCICGMCVCGGGEQNPDLGSGVVQKPLEKLASYT